MSIIHKIIDRATNTRHHQQNIEEPGNGNTVNKRRSFFGFGSLSSTSSSSSASMNHGSTNYNHKERNNNSSNSQQTSATTTEHNPTTSISTNTASSSLQNIKEEEGEGTTSAEKGNKANTNNYSKMSPEEKEREFLRQQYLNYDRIILAQRNPIGSDGKSKRPKLKIDDFHLLRTLGTGSFGRVHLAQSKHNGRYYAIKVLEKAKLVRLKQVEHTNSEKHILESAAHPFMVNLWGTFQDDQNLYMIFDYVPGGELFSVLRKNHRFPDHVAKFYAAEVLLALEYFHSKQIVYRDLKPENLLLDSQGHVKITDFGFAKYVPDVTWTLCGTPDYLAPEIIQSKGYGMAADWWSLGILIFEMLAGHPPFYDDDHLKLYEKIIAGKIRWPSYFDPHAKDLLKRLLTPDLSRRYGNLKGGAEDIKRHKWFAGVDFIKLANRQVKSPYIPKIRYEGDASHFDTYPEESTLNYGVVGAGPDPYREKFPDF